MILTIGKKCKASCDSGYLNKNESSCVADCKLNDFGRKINSAGVKCIDACANNEWFNLIDNRCKECINSGTLMS